MVHAIMWRLAIVAAVAVCPAVDLLAAEDEAAKVADAELKQTLKRLVDGLKRGDVDGVLACYAESDDVVAIQSYGRKAIGVKELRKLYASTFEEVAFEQVDLAVFGVN
ncbi:MAG: hypothetical protein WD875_11090 [Pirellulales bacterium]